MSDIEFKLYDPLNIQIETKEYDYIRDVQEHLSDYVPGYRFMPRFRVGGWNGKISLFKKHIRSFPYGLILMVLKFTKSQFPELDYTITDEVKSLFNGYKIKDYNYNLLLTPYEYQQSCIESSINKSKGIIVVATAGGKSLIISYIIDIINKCDKNNKSLIIVPTLQLVDQFKGDLVEYGIPHTNIGMVNSSRKEFDMKIVVSTWQSLKNQLEKLPLFNTVIADECIDGDTLILTNKGHVPIKNICVNDIVISYNRKTNTFETDIVENVFVNNPISNNEDMYELIIENGNILKITGNHEVLTNNGKVKVKDLNINDDILSYSI